MKYKVKITKIRSTHNNLRTDEVIGTTETLTPSQGTEFIMIGKSLTEEGLFRYVHTTKIKKVRDFKDENGDKVLNKYEIATQNSLYTVEYLD